MTIRTYGILASVIGSALGAWFWNRQRAGQTAQLTPPREHGHRHLRQHADRADVTSEGSSSGPGGWEWPQPSSISSSMRCRLASGLDARYSARSSSCAGIARRSAHSFCRCRPAPSTRERCWLPSVRRGERRCGTGSCTSGWGGSRGRRSRPLSRLPRSPSARAIARTTCAARSMPFGLPDRGQELLVVDNHPSTDATLRLVREYPAVRYIREDRPGLDVARNRAMREAMHDIIAFCDDDAVVEPEWLDGLCRNFSDPQVLCVTGLTMPLELETEAQEFFEQHSPFGRGFRRVVFDGQRDNPLVVGKVGAGANMALRRGILDLVGPFDEALDAGHADPVRRRSRDVLPHPRGRLPHRVRPCGAQLAPASPDVRGAACDVLRVRRGRLRDLHAAPAAGAGARRAEAGLRVVSPRPGAGACPGAAAAAGQPAAAARAGGAARLPGRAGRLFRVAPPSPAGDAA
jgi:hypothetical protein